MPISNFSTFLDSVNVTKGLRAGAAKVAVAFNPEVAAKQALEALRAGPVTRQRLRGALELPEEQFGEVLQYLHGTEMIEKPAEEADSVVALTPFAADALKVFTLK